MEEKIYACRTEEIRGIRYHIKMLLNGELRMSTSCEGKEETDRYVASMSKALPHLTFEVTEHPWTSNVCIECGREEY